MQIIWQIPQNIPTLPKNIIHVWAIALDDPTINTEEMLHKFWAILAHTEQQRAQRFAFSQLRKKFIITRAILKILLGHYLKLNPQEIALQKTVHGKPALPSSMPNGETLQFNVSHSNDAALMAFAWEMPLGIDIEFIKKTNNLSAIAQRFFHPQEINAIHSSQDFFNCWTRKEAFIKALGIGLSFPLNSFAVETHNNLQTSPLPININIETSLNNYAALLRQYKWQILALSPPSHNYVAALAMGGNEASAPQILQYCFKGGLFIDKFSHIY
jgi:4'-phosphopantetheinyl transferase